MTIKKHSKARLLRASAFRGVRDLLEAVLEDGKEYTLDQVRAMVDKYKRKEMKEC